MRRTSNPGIWEEMRAIAARHGRGGATDAGDDLAQDLAVATLEADGAAARRPGAWLERVGRNAAIDRWRVEHRRGQLAPHIEPPHAPPDPEAALLVRERRQLVRRAVAGLPRPQRRAALLRFHADLPFETVGARMGTAAVTARTRLQRALVSLRARLGGLRALFIWPGAQTAALGLTLIAVEAPSLTSPSGAVPVLLSQTTALTGRGTARAASGPDIPAVPAAATSLTTPSPAPVQRQRAAKRTAPSTPEQQLFVFDDDAIQGGLVGPEGEPIRVVTPMPQPSLIELRRHLVPEILKSLEEL